MLVDLFCFDTRLANEAYHYTPYSSPFDERRLIVNSAYTMGGVVAHIRSLLGQDKLHMLHLLGHGAPGSVQIGTGLDANSAMQFYALNGRFDPPGWIRIHGCSVASSTTPSGGQGTWHGASGPGYQLLWYLAWYTGARVQAALNTQYYDPHFTFEGPHVTVTPDGGTTTSF
jgi:hypothetical protein